MINFYLSKNFIFINMKLLQELHNLILEKYIGSVTSNIEISIKFDVKKTSHATDQFTRTGIEGYNETPISNSELLEFLNISKSKISEKIASQEIVDGSKFVLKSNEWEMACPIVAKQKVVVFGGATGDTGKYSMTGETYMFNILNKQW